jgi:O-antigen/teichoic acid export membrane protein
MKSDGLIYNSISNVTVFAVIAIISLLVIPAIVNQYGIKGYGLIVLSRIILPTGLISILDLGLSEATTKIVARNRQNVSNITSILLFTFLIVAAISCLVAGAYYFLAEDAVDVINFDSESEKYSLINTLQLTSFFIIPLFLGVIIESLIKGYEKFIIIRIGELIVAVCFLLFVYFADYHSVEDLIFTFMVLLSIKYFGFLTYLIINKPECIKFTTLNLPFKELIEHIKHALEVLKSKIISTIYWNIAPMYIGVMSGLEGVGIYDIVMKIPKLFKSVLGQLNAVVFPYVSRRDSIELNSSVNILLKKGLMFEMYIFTPVLFFAAYFSDNIMHILGVKEYSIWFILMLVWVSFYLSFSLGSSIAVARRNILNRFNKLSMYMTLIYIILVSLLVPLLDIQGLFVAMFVSLLITLPFYIRTLSQEMQVKVNVFYKPIVISLLACLFPFMGLFLLPSSGDDVMIFLIKYVVCLLISWLIIYRYFLSNDDKKFIIREVSALINNTK